MTQITTYPMIDDFDTTLAQARDGAVGTVYLNDAVGITIPANTTTYIVVNPGKSTMQVAEINAVNNTLKTATVSSITVDKGAGVAYTQQSHPVGSVVRISTNYTFWKDIVDSINTKVNTNDEDVAMGKFADATARDAYFTSPENGNSAYLIAEGKWTDYVAGAWADRDVGTVTANATDTVAGKVEISTQAEFDAGTATGGTGASVVATNDQIRKQINTATAKTTPVNADSIGIADSAASGVIKKTTLTQLKAASDMQATTTTSGFVEMATDAEALAGTDQTRYVNSMQLNNRSGYTIIPLSLSGQNIVGAGTYTGPLLASADANDPVTSTSYTKVKEIAIPSGISGTVSVYFEARHNNVSGSSQYRVYKNGIAVGTEVSISSSSATYNGYLENISVSGGDLIQLYIKWFNFQSGECQNFRLIGSILPDSLVLTVNLN